METDHEIEALQDKYKQLETIVLPKMHSIFDAEDGFQKLQILHRIKTIESIKEKMIRKSDNYSSVHELQDILGFRIICFFSSDIDLIAKVISRNFRVDWKNSTDKRQIIDVRSFGYLSLHYICALPEGEGELSDLWFEVQIETLLQNSWAEIEHDLGYKTAIEIPREIRRNFSRAASLLETTDIIFSNIKKSLEEYKERIKEEIEINSLDNIFFDGITLTEFTDNNECYRKLLYEIAAITDAHIAKEPGRTEKLLLQLEFFEIHTFKDMVTMIEENHNLALKLAEESLKDTGLDELSSTVAFFYLFRAKLINSGFSRDRMRDFFMLTMNDEKRIEQNIERLQKCN